MAESKNDQKIDEYSLEGEIDAMIASFTNKQSTINPEWKRNIYDIVYAFSQNPNTIKYELSFNAEQEVGELGDQKLKMSVRMLDFLYNLREQIDDNFDAETSFTIKFNKANKTFNLEGGNLGTRNGDHFSVMPYLNHKGDSDLVVSGHTHPKFKDHENTHPLELPSAMDLTSAYIYNKSNLIVGDDAILILYPTKNLLEGLETAEAVNRIKALLSKTELKFDAILRKFDSDIRTGKFYNFAKVLEEDFGIRLYRSVRTDKTGEFVDILLTDTEELKSNHDLLLKLSSIEPIKLNKIVRHLGITIDNMSEESIARYLQEELSFNFEKYKDKFPYVQYLLGNS